MELRALKHLEMLKMRSLGNKILAKKIAIYDAGRDGLPFDDDEPAARDESDLALDANFIRQSFEANVFRIFKNNTISAQNFISMIPESDYVRFNTIFPLLVKALGNQPMASVIAVANMANTLMDKKVPGTAPATATAAPATATATAPDNEVWFIDKNTGRQLVKCSLDECRQSKPFPNTTTGRNTHAKTNRHITALQQLVPTRLFPSTPAGKSTPVAEQYLTDRKKNPVAQCLYPECAGTKPYPDSVAGRVQHSKNRQHQAALLRLEILQKNGSTPSTPTAKKSRDRKYRS